MSSIAAPAAGDRPITVLHVSDPQFGKNHRFAQRDLSGWDAPFETLLARLTEDLRALREQHGLAPDLLVVTGDLAEWGLRSEFDDALKFLRGLCDFLKLPPSRVVIIPGNHDINRPLCEGYFSQCKGLEQDPAFPYWPKWELFARFFNGFYGDSPGVQFTEEIPWSLFAFEDLKVVVAGLNSTMRESHRDEDHYGWTGERQLTWFRDRLEQYRRDGWLRIGTVHHNYRRGPTRDDENLQDADDLKRVLGYSLNLLLHGHTHDGKLDWIHPGLPVLSTGSAALKPDQRPPEVPNQYQILQIWADRFCRWTRGFAPDEKRWIGDNRASEDGSRWWDEQRVGLKDVSATFPEQPLAGEPETEDRDDREELRRSSILDRSERKRDDFLSRVLAVCRLREPESDVERLPGTGSFGDYLRITRRSGGIIEIFPIGTVEHGLGQESLQAFLAEVDSRYRRADPGLVSVLVYGGEPAGKELVREAEARRVHLQTFVEYQGLIDFRTYLAGQTAKLTTDPIYPPRLYVPQRMRVISLLGLGEEESEDALAQVREWLASPHGRFIVLLGEFGTGKTFLLHELARRMGREDAGLIPILLQMRSLEKGRSLDALLAQHFAQEKMEGFSPAKFRYMLEQGRIALLFDGFDELALRVTYGKAADHFETLLQAAGGNAKVILTSRRQHFLSENQVKTALTERVESLSGHRLAILQPFTRKQVHRFLLNFFQGDEKRAEARLDLIDRVKDLLGLSSNPRLLGFIADLPEDQLVQACTEGGEITAAKLYELLLNRWLVFEFERVHPKGAPPGLSVEERWRAVTLLATKLWQKTDRFVGLSELTEQAAKVVQAVGPAAPDSEVAAFQVGSGTLLVRDDEGNFSFLHQSILEWLVAKSAAEELARGIAPKALAARDLSPLMADFFASIASRETAVAWARSVLSGPAGETAKKNALLVLERQKEKVQEAVNLAGQDLRGEDLSGQDLSSTDLSGADLTEARLIGTRLTSAKLVKTVFRDADLSQALLTGADLTGADLTDARLLGADLQRARLEQARLRRAKLLGAAFDVATFEESDTFGAAWSHLSDLGIQLRSKGESPMIAWSPGGDLLASAHENLVFIWHVDRGREIRALCGHQGSVRSVAFSPSGKTLASASDDCTVRLWHVDSGSEIRAFKGHQTVPGMLSTKAQRVLSVAFSPDGKTLASAFYDNTIQLWQVDSGSEIHAFKGQQKRILSVAFSPDGKTLASASDDNTVRLWDVGSGSEIHVFKGHRSWVRSVAFSPDGKTLASASDDNTVRLWHVGSGSEIHAFKGHENWVVSVAFSPDGKTLASASSDNTVQLWHVDGGSKARVFTGHKEKVMSVAFSPDGKTLASTSDDKTIRLWHVDSGSELRTFTGRQNWVLSVVFSPDGKTLASASSDNTLRLWHVDNGSKIRDIAGHQNRVLGVAFSLDGKTLASADDNTVRLWHVDNGSTVRAFTGEQKKVLSVAFSPDGKTLASGDNYDTIQLWKIDSGRMIHTFTRGRQSRALSVANVLSLAFSPDGKTLASGASDSTVCLWQVDDRSDKVRTLAGHQSTVRSMAFSPDGKTLASASDDHTVRLWQVDRPRKIRTLTEHQGTVRSVAFSPDGKTLASASDDNTVRLWQVNSNSEARAFRGHQNCVLSVAFSPDGKTLASGSDDNTVRLWDVATGRCLVVLLPFPEGWAAFSPDGRYKFGGVPAGGFWHAISLCRFEPGELDEWIPGLRLADDASFFDLPEWKPEVRSPGTAVPIEDGPVSYH